MYALKVSINEKSPVIGGADDLGVLTAIVTCSGKLGAASVSARDDETQDFSFRLGGLTSRQKGTPNEHQTWLTNNELKLGDKITIEIVETENPDPVISGKVAEQREHDERKYFDHCKRAYLEMRSKYETES